MWMWFAKCGSGSEMLELLMKNRSWASHIYTFGKHKQRHSEAQIFFRGFHDTGCGHVSDLKVWSGFFTKWSRLSRNLPNMDRWITVEADGLTAFATRRAEMAPGVIRRKFCNHSKWAIKWKLAGENQRLCHVSNAAPLAPPQRIKKSSNNIYKIN